MIRGEPHLPYDINGNVVYELPYDPNNRFSTTVDGRNWGHRDKSRRSGFTGNRFLAKCKGYFQCLNPRCPHIYQYNTINKVNFTSKGVCRSCHISVADANGLIQRQPCPARKIWEFGVEKVIVYHWDHHTCTAKTAVPKKDAENHFLLHPGAKPCEARIEVLGDLVRKGVPLQEIEKTANVYREERRHL